MDRSTVDVYERRAKEWESRRSAGAHDLARSFAARVPDGAVRLDLGCGPGWHAPDLGQPLVALDAARAMLDLVPAHDPVAWRVQGDLEALPFRRGALAGTWAHKCYQHVLAERVPLALAGLHHATRVGGRLHVRVTSDRLAEKWDDPFAGRHFSYWPAARLADVVTGAGFAVESLHDDGEEWLDVEAVRVRSLPDTVGPAMRLLVVGLNPSEYAADVGVGFARPGNRFWPAALAAGIVTHDRDPFHALRVHGVGMTDLVKRATPRADAISREEFAEGTARVGRLVEWLAPGAVCFVGLTGYRAAVDRRATAGWQERAFADRPAYVMPNTSGLNARVPVDDLAAHLCSALDG